MGAGANTNAAVIHNDKTFVSGEIVYGSGFLENAAVVFGAGGERSCLRSRGLDWIGEAFVRECLSCHARELLIKMRQSDGKMMA